MDELDRAVGRAEDVRRAYEAAPFAMASVVGPDLVFATSNAAYRRMFGRTDFVGLAGLEVFPELAGQQAAEMLDRVRRTGQAVAHTSWRFDVDVDGSGRLRTFYFDWFATPVLDRDGGLDGVQITQVDVTERVRRELEVQTGAGRDRRQHHDALAVVTALQDALLPTDLPVVPCLDIEARYLLAGSGGVGGDWFDAVVRADGHVALVVGDVVGHGAGASAVMGQLRAVLHSQLLLAQPLSDALAVLDLYASRHHESHATTVCVVEVDVDSGRLEYCTAGHPPPLVVSGDGDPRYLEPSGAGPLAVGSSFATREAAIEVGELVVMFTDGLVERPGTSSPESTVQLSEVFRSTVREPSLLAGPSLRPVQRVCETGLELLTRETGYDDDITLLAAQRRAAPADFSASWAATAAAVPLARDGLSDWLAPFGISGIDDIAVRHAIGELVTNAVLHAHADERPQRPHTVALHASVDRDGVLECDVRDDGHWRSVADDEGGGRGLGMVRGMIDELSVDAASTGTTATFRHRLSRTASMFTAGPAVRTPPGREPSFGITVDGARITLVGTLDGLGAERLRLTLLRVGRGGTRAVRVDLTAVTYLGSVGVRVLHERLRGHAPTTLVAPVGTVAQHVLDMVHVPYEDG